jgi:hypothetical protein
MAEVQFGHRVARTAIAEQQCGHSFVGLAADALFKRLTCRTHMKTANATIRKSDTRIEKNSIVDRSGARRFGFRQSRVCFP